ncbi:MAG: hypothetical protein WC007_17655, partial [Pelobacteraceae bacterium]
MGIWDFSGKDEKFKFLEEERVKLWNQLRIIEAESRDLKKETYLLKEESVALKDAVDKKTSDYESEAKNAAKKAVEYKNKSVAAKDTITQQLTESSEILESIKSARNSIDSLNAQLVEIVNSSVENHNNVIEAFEDIQSRKQGIEDQITKLEVLFNNHNTYANNVKALEDIATTGQETSTKIDVLHKSILTKKKEIDGLYFEIIGYTEKDAAGVEHEVPGLKDELEESYSELKNNLAKTQEELTVHKNKQIADSLNFTNQKEAQFNNTLKKWNDEYVIVLDSIRSLLPKALTAGLSHAYEVKKRHEILTSKALNKKFIGGIVGMICVSLIPFFVSLYFLTTEIKSLEEVIKIIPRLVIAILPLYVPVLWLAYSANKSLNLSKRLIEEYTHKEVLSKTFEGLSRQIENIEDEELSSDLRIRLLYNILEVNSENPGKLISDYNKSDHPLMDALDKSVKLGSAVNRLSEIPGMSRLANMLGKNAKRIMKENMKRAEEG